MDILGVPKVNLSVFERTSYQQDILCMWPVFLPGMRLESRALAYLRTGVTHNFLLKKNFTGIKC